MKYNKPLFKYMKLEYAKRMIEHGEIRIGTLYDFRKIEQYGAWIGDNAEGTKSTYLDERTNLNYGKAPEFVRKVITYENEYTDALKSDFGSLDNVPNTIKDSMYNHLFVEIRNCTFEYQERSPDLYVYCVTEEFDKQQMQEAGYDSCVRIDKPYEFFDAVTFQLLQWISMKGYDIASCIYTARRQHHTSQNNTSPAFIKDVEYASQKEVRVVWMPKEKEISPLFIKSTVASKSCSLMLGD